MVNGNLGYTKYLFWKGRYHNLRKEVWGVVSGVVVLDGFLVNLYGGCYK